MDVGKKLAVLPQNQWMPTLKITSKYIQFTHRSGLADWERGKVNKEKKQVRLLIGKEKKENERGGRESETPQLTLSLDAPS